MTYLLRHKTVLVRLRQGGSHILIGDETRSTPGNLIPSRIDQKDDRSIIVERRGKPWEIKRMELRFANAQDATNALLMLKRLLR